MQDPREWPSAPKLDPTQGTVIREPLGNESGYWVGAPSATFDPSTGDFYLVYRIRRPRGVEPDRGAEIRIAKGSDGIHFDDIWTGTKDQLKTTSIERCSLLRLEDRWQLYVSHVDPSDGRWRIDVVEASSPEEMELERASRVLTAADIGAEGVKDPFLCRIGGTYHMIVSYAVAAGRSSAEEMHGTHDAYNTGRILSATGLATSDDGREWTWRGSILQPSESGWDRYCSRIGCVWYQAPVWMALYDGSASVEENYEERCGLACGPDLEHLEKVTPHGPLFEPPHGRFALRYFDVLSFPDRTFLYYEMALPNGSHDLRVLVEPR